MGNGACLPCYPDKNLLADPRSNEIWRAAASLSLSLSDETTFPLIIIIIRTDLRKRERGREGGRGREGKRERERESHSISSRFLANSWAAQSWNKSGQSVGRPVGGCHGGDLLCLVRTGQAGPLRFASDDANNCFNFSEEVQVHLFCVTTRT